MRFLLVIIMVLTPSSLCATLDSGLVAWWNFCSCDAMDNSGHGYNGTIYSNPECIEQAVDGQALRFNTTDEINDCDRPGGDYIRVPVLPAVWQDGFTVTAWAQFEEERSYERIIDFGNASGDLGGLPVWFGRVGASNNLCIESWIDGNPGSNRQTGRLTASNAIVNGEMHFYGATVNKDGVMTLYIDGVKVADKVGHPVANVVRSSNFIGRSNWCSADPDFKGILDEVRIYNRALDATEIKELFLYRNINTLPTFPDTAICPHVPITLSTIVGKKYAWSPSSTLSCTDCRTPIATPDTTTTYVATVTTSDGCMLLDSITVFVSPLRVSIAASALSPCLGDTVTLSVGSSYDVYRWSTGDTTQSIVVSTSGSYTVEVRNRAGCKTTSNTITLTFTPQTALIQPLTNGVFTIGSLPQGASGCRTLTITNIQNTTLHIPSAFLMGNTAFSLPLHQFPLEIPSGKSITLTLCYHAVTSGTHYDTLHLPGFCNTVIVSATSIPFAATALSRCNVPIAIGSTAQTSIGLLSRPFPNPAGTILSVSMTAPQQTIHHATCTLYTPLGVPVLSGSFAETDIFIPKAALLECTLDVQTLPSGLYLAVVLANGAQTVFPVSIHR